MDRILGWFMVMILFLFVVLIVPGIGKGAGPIVGSDGWLRWDFTGLVARQENETERERIKQEGETERERIRQQNQTERNEDGMQALQWLGLLAAGTGGLWLMQHYSTKREAIRLFAARALPAQRSLPQLPPVANLYITMLIPGGQGEVIDVQGRPMIRDDTRRQLIPLDVAARELEALGLLPPPPQARLTGPTIDGA